MIKTNYNSNYTPSRWQTDTNHPCFKLQLLEKNRSSSVSTLQSWWEGKDIVKEGKWQTLFIQSFTTKKTPATNILDKLLAKKRVYIIPILTTHQRGHWSMDKQLRASMESHASFFFFFFFLLESHSSKRALNSMRYTQMLLFVFTTRSSHQQLIKRERRVNMHWILCSFTKRFFLFY